MTYSVMYRGFLTSCNYSCSYCPFAKRFESRAQLERDERSLQRFVEWLTAQTEARWRILFTPWGEALARPWYRNAMINLSQLPHVVSVTAQTNLSCTVDWVRRCDCTRAGFWATFHPTEVDLAPFVAKVARLRDLGASLSVGMVAVPAFIDQIETLRMSLPTDVYMWLNAQQPRPRAYTRDEISRLTAVDPHFDRSLRRERSYGKLCRSGETTFTVDGKGDMRRCHFVDDVIGNIFTSNWRTSLLPRECPNQFCNCYLGKAQLQADEFTPFFGEQALERIALASNSMTNGATH
jgi:MoaA/NifB/PqqE/SkfB family radical SAM enzyme